MPSKSAEARVQQKAHWEEKLKMRVSELSEAGLDPARYTFPFFASATISRTDCTALRMKRRVMMTTTTFTNLNFSTASQLYSVKFHMSAGVLQLPFRHT